METLESLKSRLKGAVGVDTDEALAEIEKGLKALFRIPDM